MGFDADDVNLVLQPALPLGAAGSPAYDARGRPRGRAGTVRRRAGDRGDRGRNGRRRCSATAHLQRLFAHWDEHGRPDLSSFRLVAHASAPCPPALKHRLIDAFPPGSTWEFYTARPRAQFTACPQRSGLERPGTAGRARPGRSPRWTTTARIWCAVPPYARFEYFGDPETAAPGAAARSAWRRPGGSTRTATSTSRGRHDLIITGGVSVYPLEVENAAGEHPGVVDIAVYGVPTSAGASASVRRSWGPSAPPSSTRSRANGWHPEAPCGVPPPRRPAAHAHRQGPPRPARRPVRRQARLSAP